ncbi:MAG: hypothetical protein JSU00_29440 [Acidobacteria bacterium]|nr:hypothetical protein [Acidobacteriota bacterium]
MPDPTKPLNRLKPFQRINNDAFLPASAPDGNGVACGCHTPDEFPNLDDEFRKYLEDPKNTGVFGNLLAVMKEAEEIANTVAKATQAAIIAANTALAIAGSALLGPLGPVIGLLTTIAGVANAVSKVVNQITKIINDGIKEFMARIGATLARRAIRRLPQWVPVVKGESNRQITKNQIVEVEGTVTRSYGDPIESPFFQHHRWLNWSFQVRPEDRYSKLLVEGFSLNGDGRKGGESPIIEQGSFEVQWDAGALFGPDGAGPFEAGFEDTRMPDIDGPMTSGDTRVTDWIWPMKGMYAWASGRWVYDCARTDDVKGSSPKMTTMMTPPRAVATAWWEARQFSENLSGQPSSSGQPSNRTPAIRFMFVASKNGGYMSYDAAGDDDYEFILDLPPIDAPTSPFPIGHTFAHKRDPGEAPDFPHNTIVIRPRLLRELSPLAGLTATDAFIKPVIEILPPPKDKVGAPPQQVKLTIKGSDLAGAKGGAAGFVLSLGWLDPNLAQASTVKNCSVAFSALQGRLAIDRDSPLNQFKPLFQKELDDLKDKVLEEIAKIELPSPVPGLKVTINDLINNNLKPDVLHDQVKKIGEALKAAIKAGVDAAFDKIFDSLADIIAGTQTEEWLMRFGVNGRWETRYLQSVDKGKVHVLGNAPTFQIPLGPDDLLFYSTSGVEFNPVGDMMCAPHKNRVLKDANGQELTWEQIANAKGDELRSLMFDYALKTLVGNSANGLLAMGVENSPLGIKDPGSFSDPGDDPEISNPISMKHVEPGSTQLQPVTKFARAAGEEFILVEDSQHSDYKLTGLIQIAKQQPQ